MKWPYGTEMEISAQRLLEKREYRYQLDGVFGVANGALWKYVD